MTIDQIIHKDRAEKMSRKQVRRELYAADDVALWARRDDVMRALGMAPTAVEPEPIPQPVPMPAKLAAIAKSRRKRGNQYSGKCEVTGEPVAAGDGVCVRYGDAWCLLGPTALTVCTCAGDERKLLSACLEAGGSDDGTMELDHEEYSLLESLAAAMTAAGLEPGDRSWSDALSAIGLIWWLISSAVEVGTRRSRWP